MLMLATLVACVVVCQALATLFTTASANLAHDEQLTFLLQSFGNEMVTMRVAKVALPTLNTKTLSLNQALAEKEMECYETSNPNGDGFNMYEEQDFANCTAAVFKTSSGDFCFSLADTRPANGRVDIREHGLFVKCSELRLLHKL